MILGCDAVRFGNYLSTLNVIALQSHVFQGIEDHSKRQSKGKFQPRTDHEVPEGEQRYNTTLSLTSALDAVGGQHHATADLPPGKTRYLLYRKLGGPQLWSGQVRKISLSPGLDPRTFQPVACRYTDYATPASLEDHSVDTYLVHVRNAFMLKKGVQIF